MNYRVEDGLTYIQSYNAENRIMGVVLTSGDCDTLPLIDEIKLRAFTYDGDGCGLPALAVFASVNPRAVFARGEIRSSRYILIPAVTTP